MPFKSVFNMRKQYCFTVFLLLPYSFRSATNSGAMFTVRHTSVLGVPATNPMPSMYWTLFSILMVAFWRSIAFHFRPHNSPLRIPVSINRYVASLYFKGSVSNAFLIARISSSSKNSASFFGFLGGVACKAAFRFRNPFFTANSRRKREGIKEMMIIIQEAMKISGLPYYAVRKLCLDGKVMKANKEI